MKIAVMSDTHGNWTSQEVWKESAIPGYLVSTLGRIYSTPRTVIRGTAEGRTRPYPIKGCIRKLSTDKRPGKGYKKLVIIDGKSRSYPLVHRMVAEAFLPNPEGKKEVDHINGDPGDNRLSNLRWATRSENLKNVFKSRERFCANCKAEL